MLNPSIALGIKPLELESPANLIGKVYQLQAAQQQNMLGRLQLEDAQATANERNAIAGYMPPGGSFDTPQAQTDFLTKFPRLGPAIIKSRLDVRKSQADIGKTEAETRGLDFKQRQDQINVNLQRLGSVSTPEEAAAWVVGGLKSGFIDMKQASDSISKIPTDPQAFQQWKANQQRMGLSLKDQLESFSAKPQLINNGQQQLSYDMNPNSPTFGKQVGPSVQNQLSPSEQAHLGVDWFNARKPQIVQTDRGAFSVAPYSTIGLPVQAGGAAPAPGLPIGPSAPAQGGSGAAQRVPPSGVSMPPVASQPQQTGGQIGAKDYYTPEAMKLSAQYGNDLSARVREGADLMSRVNEMRSALNNFQPGMGAEARLQAARAVTSLAQGLGVPEAKALKYGNAVASGDQSSMQEFDKLSAQSAMSALKQAMGTSGRITQAEFKVFLQNNPNIALSRPAMNAIFDFMQHQYQRDYSEQQGRQRYLDQGGDPSRWPSIWSQRTDPSGTGNIGMPGAWKIERVK